MLSRDWKDIIGGALLMAIGAFAAFYAWHHYAPGTVRRMGPGMFPISLGVILFFAGGVVALPAFLRGGRKLPPVAWRELLTITIAGLVFAIALNRIGIIPATVLLVLISASAANKLTLARSAVYAVCVAVVAWLIFEVALSLPVQAFRWPF